MPKIFTINHWRQILTSKGAYQPIPRVLLYYFAVPFELAASAIAGIGFVLYAGNFLLLGNFLWVIWFIIMFFVSLQNSDILLQRISGFLKKGALSIFILLVMCGITESITLIVFHSNFVPQSDDSTSFGRVMIAFDHGFGYSDSTALSYQAAENLLNGKNPYKHANVVEALLKFSPYPDRVTPLRVGRFANEFPYPTPQSLKQVWDDAIKNPDKITPEYANSLAYPAGDFLIPAIFMLAGINDIRIVYAILVVLALAYVVYRLKSPQRYYLIGVALISLQLWNSIANGETGTLALPFLLLGWFLLKRNAWVSAVCMGIAIATKQTAWFFIPFYLIAMFKTYKLKRASFLTATIGGIFLIMNLPFMISDLNIWVNSVFTPMNGKMFPLGVGLVTLVTGGVINIQSPIVFDIMEFIVLIFNIVWYFRYYDKYALMGPLLSTLPLFFAWRSLWPYFFYTGMIIITLTLSGDWESTGSLSRPFKVLRSGNYRPGAS